MLQNERISGKKLFDVFLCHNSKDKPEVKKIAEQLKLAGIVPWLDEWELPPGQPWQRLLEQQMDEIKSAAVFVGKDGVGPWQQMELEALLREFVDRGCPVIPVVLADAPAKPQLPVFLRGMTWVDFHKREPDPMKQLIWGITSKRSSADASKDAHGATAITQPPVPMELPYKSSVVLISSVDKDNRSFGTGFIIEQDAGYSYILTCSHVISNAKGKEGKVKVNNVISEEVPSDTPNGAVDLGVLRVEGLLGAPLTRRKIGDEGMSFTSLGYQDASIATPDGSKESGITFSLHGELGELNFQRVRGQGFPIKLWTLKIKDDFLPEPGYSGAPVVVKTEAGEDVVIGVLSIQQRERILAISIEELDRVWLGPIYIPFTNREDELKLILSSSAPAYYLLDAPAGYGKSTLLGELRKQFSERKWSCAYLALDSSLEMDELAEAVAENLSISHLLSRRKSNQGAGFRLGSALQRYWSNSQEGLVLLFDLDPDSGNSELLERLLKEFIPEIADSLETISSFEKGDNRFRVVIAGRYLNSYYNRLSIQKLPIIPSRLHLTPFKYDVIHNSSVYYLKRHKYNNVRQIADHILYLTGGHPGCMAKVLKLYEERGMPPQKFVDQLSDTIWTDIVKPVVSSVASKIPSSSGIQKLMNNNVLRYMDYAVLRKLIDLLELSEVLDEFDLADKLTGAALLNRKNYLLYDDITRRLICLGLRNDRRDEFIQLCRTAQTICEERLHDTSTATPDKWTIEYLFQYLQQHALLINNSEQRQELRDNFMSQELPKVLQWLVTGREARAQKSYLLDSIEEDWEFMFTVNYYLRRTEYNNNGVEELKAEVNRRL